MNEHLLRRQFIDFDFMKKIYNVWILPMINLLYFYLQLLAATENILVLRVTFSSWEISKAFRYIDEELNVAPINNKFHFIVLSFFKTNQN